MTLFFVYFFSFLAVLFPFFLCLYYTAKVFLRTKQEDENDTDLS